MYMLLIFNSHLEPLKRSALAFVDNQSHLQPVQLKAVNIEFRQKIGLWPLLHNNSLKIADNGNH